MGLIYNIRTNLARAIAPSEVRDWMTKDPALLRVREAWSGGPTAAGVSVNETTALNYSAVWSAVNVISSAVASLPLISYRTLPDGSRERASGSALYWILHEEPNEETSAYYFWETAMVHVLLTGNAYAEIQRNESGGLVGLWLINPSDIDPVRKDGKLAYKYRNNYLVPSQVLHVAGMGFDGVRGYSPITIARESIALGIATERFGASYFGNGAWPGTVIKHPKQLSADAQERLRSGIEKMHQGVGRAHKTMILEEGMDLDKVTVSPEDSQFLQTREFQVTEIARWFRVPPHKLMHKTGERPGGNLESQNIEFLTDTLRPWLVRIEQECNRKLVSYRERPNTYCEFLVDSVLRADTKTRYESYAIAKDKGWLSINEIRSLENLNSIGPEGDEYGSSTPEPQALPEPVPQDEEQAPKRNSRLLLAQRAIAKDALGRLVRAEVGLVRKALEKGSPVPDVYAKHSTKMVEVLRPVLEARNALLGTSITADDFVSDYVTAALGILDGSRDVETTLAEWEQGKADALADSLFTADGLGLVGDSRSGQQVVVNLPARGVTLPAPVVNVTPPAPTTPVVKRAIREVVRDPKTNLITQVIDLSEE